MNKFPIRIHYIDNNEVVIVNSSEDIQKERPFTVEEVNIKYGRKYVVDQYLEREEL